MTAAPICVALTTQSTQRLASILFQTLVASRSINASTLNYLQPSVNPRLNVPGKKTQGRVLLVEGK